MEDIKEEIEGIKDEIREGEIILSEIISELNSDLDPSMRGMLQYSERMVRDSISYLHGKKKDLERMILD